MDDSAASGDDSTGWEIECNNMLGKCATTEMMEKEANEDTEEYEPMSEIYEFELCGKNISD